MFQHCLVLLQPGQPLEDDPAHAVEVGDLVVDFPNLVARHALAGAQQTKLVHHGGPLLLQLGQPLGAPRHSVRILNHLAASGDPATELLALLGQLGEAGLEALEQRVRVFMVGDVGKKLVGEIGEGAVLDLVGREPGAHYVGGRRPRHREHASLHRRALHLPLDLGHCGLIVESRSFGIGPDQMGRRSRDLATESLKPARLLEGALRSAVCGRDGTMGGGEGGLLRLDEALSKKDQHSTTHTHTYRHN